LSNFLFINILWNPLSCIPKAALWNCKNGCFFT